MAEELPPIPVLLKEARGAYAAAIRNNIAKHGLPPLPRDGAFVLGALHNGLTFDVILRERGRSIEHHQSLERLLADGYLSQSDEDLILSTSGHEAAHVVAAAVSGLYEELELTLGEAGLQSFLKGLVTLIEIKESEESD